MTVRIVDRTKSQNRKRHRNEIRFGPPSTSSFTHSAAAPSAGSENAWVVVHLHVDVCDAMGANAASAVAEGVAPFMANLINARVGIRIVSNLCTQRISKVCINVPDHLK
jgi:hydroxymethylglutaryl-CoA reductase